jgi:hypothetical protein
MSFHNNYKGGEYGEYVSFYLEYEYESELGSVSYCVCICGRQEVWRIWGGHSEVEYEYEYEYEHVVNPWFVFVFGLPVPRFCDKLERENLSTYSDLFRVSPTYQLIWFVTGNVPVGHKVQKCLLERTDGVEHSISNHHQDHNQDNSFFLTYVCNLTTNSVQNCAPGPTTTL